MEGMNEVIAGREVVQVDWRDPSGMAGERCRVIVWTPRDWRPGKRATVEEDEAGREEALLFERVGGVWHLYRAVK